MLQGFKEHLGNWLRDGFYFNKNRCDPVLIARTARFTRNANQFLHIPDCFDNEGILKLYNLRCEDSEFFGQDGYIRYDTVCLRCRGEKWTVYHPAELQVPENPLMLQPTPKRRMRSCIPNIWCWFRNIGRRWRGRGGMPKRGKKDKLAIKKTMWKQPWMYWDSDKRMCRADDDAYAEEYKQKLLKDFDEKKGFCTKYDDDKRAEAAWMDKKMAARAENWNTCFGRMKYRMLWWPQTFLHWLKGKGIHVGRWFKRVGKKNKSCQGGKKNEDSTTTHHPRSFLMGLFCCSKKKTSDEEEAAVPEEIPNNTPKKLTDPAEEEHVHPAEETANGSSNESVETEEESAHDPVNSGTETDAATDTTGGDRDVSAQTLVNPTERTERSNSTTTTALGDESSGVERNSAGENSNSNDDSTVSKGNRSQNKGKLDKSRNMTKPCFDVFTDLDRFDQLKDVVAFMKHPSGELVMRENWSWETLGKLKAVHAIYAKPPLKEMGFRWKMKWYLCAILWPFKGRIRYIDDQADYLQLDAFTV